MNTWRRRGSCASALALAMLAGCGRPSPTEALERIVADASAGAWAQVWAGITTRHQDELLFAMQALVASEVRLCDQIKANPDLCLLGRSEPRRSGTAPQPPRNARELSEHPSPTPEDVARVYESAVTMQRLSGADLFNAAMRRWPDLARRYTTVHVQAVREDGDSAELDVVYQRAEGIHADGRALMRYEFGAWRLDDTPH